MRTRLFSAWALAGLLLSPRVVEARAGFVVDAADDGLRDPTPASPVGGNQGTTLGEQRRIVIERALSIWGESLDSAVPIVVRVSFSEESCTDHGAPIAGATATHWLSAPGASASLLYPAALADRIAGYDLNPGLADIDIELNSSLVHAPCATKFPLYYGLDGRAGGRIDLVATTLHELGHGLGFQSFVNLQTGQGEIPVGMDVFSSHVRDLDLDETWDQMSDAQRARSALNVRRLVFDGAETERATQGRLDRGTPTLALSPALPGFSGSVAPVGLAPSPVDAPASGPVELADPVDGCGTLKSASGKVLIVKYDGQCYGTQVISHAEQAGAAAVLFVLRPNLTDITLPGLPIGGTASGATIPAITLGPADSTLIERALTREQTITATLGADRTRLAGADARGRPLLFATTPIVQGSSVSHFEPLAHPDLLMEPYTTDTPKHELDLTQAVMHDLGWTPFCGDGKLQDGEECDQGAQNLDRPDSACRTTCHKPSCGDGVVDSGEQCDQGRANSDAVAGACRTNCTPARCGDGVRDPDEACDGSPSCTSSCEQPKISVWDQKPMAELQGDPSGCRLGVGASEGEALSALLGLAALLSARRRRA